jgi:hypothetical protein
MRHSGRNLIQQPQFQPKDAAHGLTGHAQHGSGGGKPFKPQFEGVQPRTGYHHAVTNPRCDSGHIAVVNNSFNHWNTFRPGYYRTYPGAWYAAGLAAGIWNTVGWNVLSPWCGCRQDPVYYYYGENVCYRGDNVYYGDQPVATAEQYYDQAAAVAASGQVPRGAEEQWLPLGVFGLVSEGQTKPDKVIQLAVNKEGQIRGNYYDTFADTMLPLVGSVDKATQRAAWRLKDNDTLLMEAGVYSLTEEQAPVLVHYGQERTESRVLIRLQQPNQGQPGGREF